jgi:hypothetical protein
MKAVDFSVDNADSTIRVGEDISTIVIEAARFSETSVYF